ncbi:MAG TPA: branched-chain amino acid ABC transporter substrate-binding protein [Gemmatimonadaceae bacterium]|nr:branched-chain amino acid ABC transporter substrate-binding protein [Gemmatimonadaceae bacterium]
MTVGQLIAAVTFAAAIGTGSTSCARGARASGGDTLFVAVAATRTSAAYFRGALMAIDRLNAERPQGSRPFGMRMPPTVQTTQVAVAARFRDDPSVIGVVGHTGSAQTMEAAPIYADAVNGGRNAVVAVTPTATNPQVTRVNRWVFRICPTDDDAARALARFAIDSLHVQRVAVVYRNDLFGRGFTRAISPELSGSHVAIAERDPYLADITEYQAYAARIARSGIEAVIFAGGGVDAADLVRALHNESAHPVILGTDDVASILDGVKTVVAKALPTKGRGRRGPSAAPATTDDRALFRGVRFTSFYDASRTTDGGAKQFAVDFARRFGQAPTPQAALTYDATMLIGRAALAVGPDRKLVRDWIASVGTNSAPMHGVTGDIRFDDHGDAIGKPVVIGRIVP